MRTSPSVRVPPQEGGPGSHPYVDTFGEESLSLGASGIPLTVLIDREGREIGRKLGAAAWDHPRNVQMIRGYQTPAATPSEPAQR